MKKLLIVVDYQNDFVSGALGFPEAVQIEEGICRKIRQYRQQGQDVVYTMDTHGPDYAQTQEGRKLPVVHCVAGAEGWRLYGQTAALLKDCRRFDKPSFGSLELADWLKDQDYQQIELCGVVTNICVVSNAVLCKAALPEAEIIVDAACVASPDPKAQQAALETLKSVQIAVLPADAGEISPKA